MLRSFFVFVFFLRFHRAEVRGKLFVKNYKTFPARSMKFRATPSNPLCPSASKHALHPSFSCRSTISSSQQSKMSQSKLNDPTGLTCALLFLTSPHMIVPSYKKISHNSFQTSLGFTGFIAGSSNNVFLLKLRS